MVSKNKTRSILLSAMLCVLLLFALCLMTACEDPTHEHQWGEWTTVTEPDCTTEGSRERTCSDCGEKQTETLPAAGHAPGVWQYDEYDHWQICSECEAIINEGAHETGTDGACSKCGYKGGETSEAVLKFLLSADGKEYTVSGTDGFTGGELTVPASYAGLPVTAVAERAFEDLNVTSVVLPSTVTYIGPFAFSGCSSLASASLGTGISYIGDEAFAGCTGLYSVKIGGSLEYIGDYAFEDCDKLVEVYDLSENGIEAGARDFGYVGFRALDVHTSRTQASGISAVDDFVFMETEDGAYLVDYVGTAASVVLPEDFKGASFVVNARAFFGRTDVTSVDLGGASEIGEKAFYGSGLTAVSMPDGVDTIGESAFAKCKSLVSLDLSGVSSVGKYAFEYCGLTTVFVPESVTTMGDYVFDGCAMTAINCQAASKPSGWSEYWYWYCGEDVVNWGAAA